VYLIRRFARLALDLQHDVERLSQRLRASRRPHVDEPRENSPSRALLYMAASAVLFALMSLFARIASASASWLTVASFRALVGAGVAYAVARARGASLAVVDRRVLFWRSFFGTVAMMSTF